MLSSAMKNPAENTSKSPDLLYKFSTVSTLWHVNQTLVLFCLKLFTGRKSFSQRNKENGTVHETYSDTWQWKASAMIIKAIRQTKGSKACLLQWILFGTTGWFNTASESSFPDSDTQQVQDRPLKVTTSTGSNSNHKAHVNYLINILSTPSLSLSITHTQP